MRKGFLDDIARVFSSPPPVHGESSGADMWPKAFLERQAALARSAGLHGLRKAASWRTTRPLSRMSSLFHPKDARLDELGNIICYSHYGRHDTRYGWEIDHRHPTSAGGSEEVSNLRALHWNANRAAGLPLVAKLGKER
jgi:hypothetical protein